MQDEKLYTLLYGTFNFLTRYILCYVFTTVLKKNQGLFFLKSQKRLCQVQMNEQRPRGVTELAGGRVRMGVHVLVHPSIPPWQSESNQSPGCL